MNLTAEFNTNHGRKSGTVMKVNTKTILVLVKEIVKEKEKIKELIIPKYKTIKRHIFKHNVEVKGEE
jgi:hypothetical protein